MKSFLLFAFCLLLFLSSSAQRISKVTLSATGETESFSIATDDAVVNISPEGQIINYGVEYFSERATNYSRVEPFQGRTENYTQFDDAAFQGKLKYLGRTPITYYASYETEDLRGKVKSIGRVTLDYYRPYEDAVVKGKVKMIGSAGIQWYGSFDNEALKGKLRAVGNTNISFYSSFDDKAFRGKLKAIGPINFTYYSSFDMNFGGSMKTGQQVSLLSGIYYYIK